MIDYFIQKYGLNLEGLVVYTEAASGSYSLNAILAGKAGADTVYAHTRDSRFADASEVIRDTTQAAKIHGVSDKIMIRTERNQADISKADIITNSGFVRPIDKRIIGWLKPTAVIPLMWETWEYRESDLDLAECKRRGVLVLGTNEHEPPCDMLEYTRDMGLKLLEAMGVSNGDGTVILMGSQKSLGREIRKAFLENLESVVWFGEGDPGAVSYEAFNDYFTEHGENIAAVILAEHDPSVRLFDGRKMVSFREIQEKVPHLKIGIISGNIDAGQLKNSGLYYFPEHIMPAGYMSYQPDVLGHEPILDLFAAGLKVGQEMARSRLAGHTIQETVMHAQKKSPAMDFSGDLSWLI